MEGSRSTLLANRLVLVAPAGRYARAALLSFLRSREAHAIFERFGFLHP